MNTLSVYYNPHHNRQQDIDYIHRLQPSWIRIHQPTALAIHSAQQAAPNAKIMLRSWDIDDNNGDRKSEMYADPMGAARMHLDMWDEKLRELVAELTRNGWAYDKHKWYLGLINEPDPAYLPQVVTYSSEAMRMAVLRGQRLGVVASSVGNFGKPGESGNTWDLCKPLENPINEGGHILIVHSYWQPEGPAAVWKDAQGIKRHDAGNLAWRHHAIPLNVPILIGEAGANGYIYNRHSNQDDAGWRKFMTPEQYAAQVREYIARCDARVQGVCLYMTDFHSDQWWSFDTEPAMEQLLAIKDVRPQLAPPQPEPKPPVTHTVHLPVVTGGGTVRQDDLFPKVMQFISRWEGGFVNHPDDPGGATNMGITISTLARWRGHPVTVDDVRNLTREEADAIYRALYWEPSGAAAAADYATALLLMDSAVLHGVGAPLAWVQEYGYDAWRIAARRLRVYTGKDDGQWGAFGRGWVNRVAALAEEMGAN